MQVVESLQKHTVSQSDTTGEGGTDVVGRSVDVGFEGRIANHVGIVDLWNRISTGTTSRSKEGTDEDGTEIDENEEGDEE